MLDVNSLENDLSDLPRRYTVLITGRGRDYHEAKFRILKDLCNKRRLQGMYVSQKTPVKKMFADMKRRGINTDKLFFIDATGEEYTETKREGRYLHISPNQISDLAVAMEGWVRALPKGKKFLFLDDYPALFIYNSFNSVKEFSDFITARMKMWGLRYIFISLERIYDLKLLNKIYSTCDRIIEAKSMGK